MLARSLFPIFGTLALEACLLCNPALAATRSASLVVTVTVEAACQVSPVLSAAEIAASRSTSWKNPVSVSCSLPVAYQVTVNSGRGPSETRVQSLKLSKESEPGAIRPVSLDLSAAVIKTADATAGTNFDTLTVTIVY